MVIPLMTWMCVSAESTTYLTRGEHSNHYATDAVRIIRSCMDAAETHIHVIKGMTI
jgi:hypothetical protein